MAANKKKIVLYVAAAGLCGGALVVCRGSSADSSGKQAFDSSQSLFAKDPNVSGTRMEGFETDHLYGKMILAVANQTQSVCIC